MMKLPSLIQTIVDTDQSKWPVLEEIKDDWKGVKHYEDFNDLHRKTACSSSTWRGHPNLYCRHPSTFKGEHDITVLGVNHLRSLIQKPLMAFTMPV